MVVVDVGGVGKLEKKNVGWWRVENKAGVEVAWVRRLREVR